MPKKGKIGKDILKKGGVITTKKDSEQYQKFLEEREKKKKLEQIKGKMPEEQPTDEQLMREKAKEMAELVEAKEKGLLKTPEQEAELTEETQDEEKPVNVKKHKRRKPRREF